MLLAVAVASALGAVVVTLSWALRRHDALGRARRFPVITIALLIAVAVAATVPVVRQFNQERQLSATAQALTGLPGVRVRCQSTIQAWASVRTQRGYVDFSSSGKPASTAVITPDTCAELTAWLRSDHAAPSLEQVIAVHVLTHEAMHLRGIRDEARAECAALQRDRATAHHLGATIAQARELSSRYLREVYPTMREDYSDPQCRHGGAWDEQLDSSPWN